MHVNRPRYVRERDGFRVTDDPAAVDLDVVHGTLAQSYWAEGIPRDLVARSIEGSLCFSLLEESRQIGFARMITDRATYAYLADVFVLESHRGRGLATWMMECVMAHPDLQGIRRFSLVTRDAHALYEKTGWTRLAAPERYMEKVLKNPYKR